MRIAGIVAEYNPMHSGHIYHLKKTKEISRADFVVVVMSGDFVQRGTAAVLDKWTRARHAIDAGVDLVLELPFIYATASAEMFARGAIGIMEGLGQIDAVSFGSESGDVEELSFLARFFKEEPHEFKTALARHMDMGLSFPRARELAVNECLGMDAGALLKSPNNILAIEYLKSVVSMTPIAIKRSGGYNERSLPNDDEKQVFPSAAAIRDSFSTDMFEDTRKHLSPRVYDDMRCHKDRVSKAKEKYFDILRSVVIRSGADELKCIHGMNEGIENKIKKEVRLHDAYDSYVDALKSKRYTMTAINRLMLHTVVGLKKDDVSSSRLWTRVLAFSDGGAKILKNAKDQASIPVITNLNKYDDIPNGARFDVMASDLYNLIMGHDMYSCSDHVMGPVK